MKIDEIYQGDCYELIKQVEDKSVDLVIIDPPYEFVMGGTGKNQLAKRKLNQKIAIYNLGTELTKNRISGGGCFGPKNKSYYREIANNHFVSKGFTNEILDELCRVMKKINIYIFCSKRQLRQIIDYFDDKGCNYDLLVWCKTNPLPSCNNTYLSDLEYCVFAREKGVKLYGNVKTKSRYYISSLNVTDKKDYDHPTIKPLELVKNLIINSSCEGGLC